MLKKMVIGIMLMLLLISMATLPFNFQSVKAGEHSGPYFKVEPEKVTMGPGPAVNQTFTVAVKLYNVTVDKVPKGIAGVEVNFTWDPCLIQPVSYVNKIGQSGGVLVEPVLYALKGFYNNSGIQIPAPPYTNATHYKVAAARMGDDWWGSGTIVEITFKVIYQPKDSDPAASCSLAIVYSQLISDKGGGYLLYPEYDIENGYYEINSYSCGPWMDNLYIKYYGGSGALFNALKNGEVDLTDRELTQAQIDELLNFTDIHTAISPSTNLFEFDFNNNATTPTYRDYTNPTAYKGFRQGIACLVDKDYIVNEICNYSYRIDTPVTRPNDDWWVDWSVSQYDSYGNLLGNYPYEFNSTLAAYYFDSAGFVEGETPNPYYDENFPSSAQNLRIHPETSEDLEPLIFYIRNDDPRRLEAGRILADNLRKMGIPVNTTETSAGACYTKVMVERDYHIYTGGWVIWLPIEGLSIFTSANAQNAGYNYVQFRNSTYDELCENMCSQLDIALARDAALECQRILVEEAACVWLYNPSRVTGYRNIYGVVNERGDRIDNKWTFLKARNDARAEIYYGLYSSPTSLNVFTNYPLDPFRSPTWDCLSNIYDTLLSYNPYDKSPGRGGETMPWMAEDWEIGEWQSPYEPSKNLTKLTFYLRDGIKWHDGVELNSTDVKFTIEYLKGSANVSLNLYGLVSDVYCVVAPDARTVIVYENVSNIWALDYIGSLPILPKHIFQTITNVTGYTPGANQGLPANQGLIGSGPWKYVYHNDSTFILEANRDYFMETPPKTEIDFRYDWEMGCWTVDSLETTMIGEAFGTTESHPKWQPECDLNVDGIIDFKDLIIATKDFNLTWGRSARRYVTPTPTDTAIYVEHSGNPILVGENLTVYVKLANLTNLSGIQFKLNYDKNKLNCLDFNLNQIFNGTYIETEKEVNQTNGFIWVSVSLSGSTQPINGNATLATILFNATKPSGSTLDLWNTKLASYGAPGSTCQPMAHMTIDRSVMVGVLTPSGTNVTVAPAENAKVKFAETTSGGVTTLNITQPPSKEFASVLCQDVKTTAIYTGNVTIEFNYDPTGLSLEDEQAMKIWLWNETSGSWVDITTHVDTINNIVYGVAPHLSIFGITGSINLEGNMSVDGVTTIGSPAAPPDPPPGLAALSYFEIKTTKTYTPPITLRLVYDDSAITPGHEIFLKVWLWNESSGDWVDVTTSVNTINNVIYAKTPHLSIFGITGLKPFPTEITVVEATCSKTVVGQGFNVTVNLILQNIGGSPKTFEAVAYRNSTVLQTNVLTLDPAAQEAISFTWYTTDWAKGNYAISVCNRLVEWVVITIPGDLNGDFTAQLADLVILAQAYGSEPGKPNWNPNADIDDSNGVGLSDLVILAKNYGKTDP